MRLPLRLVHGGIFVYNVPCIFAALCRRKGALPMTRTVLVGSTGFVGGNLLAAHAFDAAYHSTDVEQGFGQPNGLVVYAGVPAAMFLANRDPAADLAVMERARWNLQRLAPEKVVLVSSICVYADSRGKTEADEPRMEGLAPYGANRLQLERWVRADWPDALILRLPALYGKGLKKNFLYDLHTLTPALLRPEKYTELAQKSELVRGAYSDGGNGFYKLNSAADPAALRAFFAAGWNATRFTDSRSVYQFYDLGRLWADIQRALELDLRVLNLATPPVSAARVHQAVTGRPFENELAAPPFDYDMRTLHAQSFGGAEGYLCTPRQELEDICEFMKGWRD